MNRWLLVLVLLAASTSGIAEAQTNSRSESYYHFAKAQLLDDQGHTSQAIDEYKKALELDPNNSMIYSEMAETYLKNNRIRDAVETAQKAVKADPDNVEPHKILSNIYVQMIGRSTIQQPPDIDTLNGAIHELEEVVRIDPSERQAFLMLGRLYQIEGDRNQAMSIYRKFLGIEPGSEEGVTALAKLQMEAGNDQEAATLLEEFIKQEPESSGALETLGQAYSSMQEFAKAADAFKRASDLDPTDLELKKSEAQAFFFADNLDEAASLYEEIAATDTEDGVPLLRLGQIYRREMKYGPAREYLQKAADSFPESLEVQYNLVLLDRDEGLLEDALKRVKDILKKSERPNGLYPEGDKQNRRVFFTQEALLSSTLGRYDEAIRAFTDVKALMPDSTGRIDALIVDTYRTAKDLDKALQYCEQALAARPNNRQLQMLQADLNAEMGRVDESIRALQKMSNGTDDDLDVYSVMVSIYQRAKKFDDAQKVLNIAMQRFPNNEHVYFLQGALLEKEKKFNEAEATFRKALELDRDNPAVLNYLGFILADRGLKLDEAARLIQKAVQSDPTNGAYLDSLGWVYFKMNRLDLAESYLKKAVIFTNTDPDIHDHLGDLYFRTKRYEEARLEWTKSLQLATDREGIEKVKKKLDDLKTNRAANR